MNTFTVPEKYREQFQNALDTAVRLGSFTEAALAKELNISNLNAAILIGFMDKYEFLFPSPKNEVKTVRITLDAWEEINRDITRYIPQPLEDKTQPIVLTPVSLISGLYKKSIEITSDGAIIKTGEVSMFIPAEEVLVPHFKKAGFFKKGYIFFGECPPSRFREKKASPYCIVFTKKSNDLFDALVTSLISDIEKKL